MVVNDIVNSCSNSSVAEAAVVSIGGAFARRVRDAASRKGVRPGAWAAAAVSRYRAQAHERDFVDLQRAIAGDDQPVLAGFRLIVEPQLSGHTGRARQSACHAPPTEYITADPPGAPVEPDRS